MWIFPPNPTFDLTAQSLFFISSTAASLSPTFIRKIQPTAAKTGALKPDKTLRDYGVLEHQVLLQLAPQRIERDLDDGVKMIYLKLAEALAPIPGLAA